MTRHELARIAAMALESGAMVKKCKQGDGLNLTSRQWIRMAQDSTVRIIDKDSPKVILKAIDHKGIGHYVNEAGEYLGSD